MFGHKIKNLNHLLSVNPKNFSVSPCNDEKKKADERVYAQKECAENMRKLEKMLLPSEFEELKEVNHHLQNGLVTDTTALTGAFLADLELEVVCKINSSFLVACNSDMTERKQVRDQILPLVFSANPQGIEAFFENPTTALHPKLLLTKASYLEGYVSEKLGKFLLFRAWQGVSPLQAAYLCGDGPFLGRRLLALIINNKLPDDYRKYLLTEARQQLQELLNRININSKVANENANVSKTAERKSVVENAVTEFGGVGEFLAPLKEIIQAYNAYVSQYELLFSQYKWDEIDKLWGRVSECHKKLPCYILQEFFGNIPFDPLPKFDTEPHRVQCRYWNNDLLDLDEIGNDECYGIYKGGRGQVARGRGALGAGKDAPKADLAAIKRLCELRENDLRNTVLYHLDSLEATLSFINNDKPTSLLCG